MRVYPESLEEKIGFATVRKLLADRCLGDLGRTYVSRLKPLDKLDMINKLGQQTAEFQKILTIGESFPASNFLDVGQYLSKAKIDGSFLIEEEFYEIKISLTTIFKCLDFLTKRASEYPLLAEASGSVGIEKAVLKSIEAIIDDRGQVRDNASKELVTIRRELISSQSKVRRTLDTLLKKAKTDGFCPDDASLTIRNGRLVIPVLAEHKRRIKGFIQDESSTGGTVFMEPTEALEINNEIRELEYKERREIIRLLRMLTAELRGHIPALEQAYRFLGMIDFIRAKAILGVDTGAIWPEGQQLPQIKWKKATHPLLYLSHKKINKSVVPLQISLAPDQRILLISGPNAGGKSVCLKTVALLQYMYQCGIPVPVAEDSRFGVFQQIFIDIGDEQSIENDLSTYSGHLTHMKYFLEHANGKTLVLIDEFGTGTEPQFGGAIAEAILGQLNHKKTHGVITTHYANLKKLGEKSPGIVNGAMRFDPEKLEPLYELEIGKPGSSFALEIAGKIGLPQPLLNQARNLVGHSHVKFDQLINSLENEKSKFEEQRAALEKRNHDLEKSAKDYKDLKAFLDTEKSVILKKAKEEAKQLLADTNKLVENTIREIKEKQAEKEATKKIRDNLKSFAEEKLKPEKEMGKRKAIEVLGGEIALGDSVRIKGQDTLGEVTAMKGKQAEVVAGTLKLTLKIAQLEKVSKAEKRSGDRKVYSSSGIDYNQKAANFSENLDLRGTRAEIALGEVDTFIDQAILLGKREVRIVHGKGHGILRDMIRNYLKGNPYIQSAKDEHIERGGSGVSVVTLK